MIRIFIVPKHRIMAGGMVITTVAVFCLLMFYINIPMQLQQSNNLGTLSGQQSGTYLNDFNKYVHLKDDIDFSIKQFTNEICAKLDKSNLQPSDTLLRCEKMIVDTENIYWDLQSQSYPNELETYRQDLLYLLNLEAIRLDGIRRGIIAIEKAENYTPFFQYYDDNSNKFEKLNQQFNLEYKKFLSEK